MVAALALQEQRGSWLFVVPIANLRLADAVDYEFVIDRVRLVAGERLPYRRRRLGFPARISRLRELPGGFIARVVDSADTFAVLRRTGRPRELDEAALRLIREELAILTLSQLGYAKRHQLRPPSVSDEEPGGRRSYLILNSRDGAWVQPNEMVGNVLPFELDATWLNIQRRLFHHNLLRILTGKHPVKRSWRYQLRQAAVLAGQSQASLDLPQAFLWNMIAIECLLTTQDDTHSKELPRRVEAFLGWADSWSEEGYEDRIRDVYRKRCLLVHDGDRGCIDVDDLFFSDDLVLNLFVNITGHVSLFRSKTDIVDFSEKLRAERLLGIKPRVRPGSLRFISRRYLERDKDSSRFR